MRPVFKAFHHLAENPCPDSTAEDRRRGHPVVVERQLAGLDALVPQLGQIPRQPSGRGPCSTRNHRDARVRRLGGRIGLAQQRDKGRTGGHC